MLRNSLVVKYGTATLFCLAILAHGFSKLPCPGTLAAEEVNHDASPGTVDSRAAEQHVTQGALRVVQSDGGVVECPLKQTDVVAQVSGFIARVHVTQVFHNPTDEKIEAVYVFPLPHQAAVDSMTMVIGPRRIQGVIKRRAEARQIYEAAMLQGQTASLLEQERPNIFTQSVANIAPGEEVRIEISYVDVLKYDVQEYEFYFPMVVGPRFIPGQPSGDVPAGPANLQGNVSPPVANTDRVPDAQRISPPVLRPGVRNGHDIRLQLTIDAGVPIQNIAVPNHEARVQRGGESQATIELSRADSIPNKDFVVRYDVVGQRPEMALLTHTGDYSADARKLGNGYFMLMIQPQEDERLHKSPPREIVFLVDVSGSMQGANTAKTIDVMKQMLGLCRKIDTVQVITFASQAQKLFERPLPVNEDNIQRALNFADTLRGSGGTQMLEGVKMAIDEPVDQDRVRIVVMLTDGFIGNEAEIIEHVGRECGDHVRFWAVGIGQSPNMFLIDGVARQGGGMGKRLGLNDEAEVLATEVMTRIQRAQLAGIKIDWGKSGVSETYPARAPELWAGRPVIVYGRFSGNGQQAICVRGTIEGEPAEWPLTIDLPKSEPEHGVLAKVWARQRIEDLMFQAGYGNSPAIEEEVTAIALDYGLMSQYTSFVAVDASQAEVEPMIARPPRQMLVPVPLPEGTQWEGFFGAADGMSEVAGKELQRFSYFMAPQDPRSRGRRLAADASAPHAPFGSGFGRMSGSVGQPLAAPSSGPQPGGASPAPALALKSSSLSRSASAAVTYRRDFGDYSARGLVADEALDAFGVEGHYQQYATFAPSEQMQQLAQKHWAAYHQQIEQKDLSTARGSLVRVLFYDRAVAGFGYSDGSLGMAAQQALVDLQKQLVDTWQQTNPALARQLTLVLRDLSLSQAIERIAAEAEITIDLIDGCEQDSERLLRETPRITWLDLRGVTLAQALDWTLQPRRLTWRPERDKVIVSSARRLPDMSPWVYDVTGIALPATYELADQQDDSKKMEAIKAAVDTFLRVARSEVAPASEDDVVWFAPGQLLVFGDRQQHAKVSQLLSDLVDARPDSRRDGEVGKLQQLTLQRAVKAKERLAVQIASQDRRRAAGEHALFGWQLLAQALKGQLDDQAVTELAIAWHATATPELLQAPETRPLVLRSLWFVVESARHLPDQPRLTELAQFALQQAEDSIDMARQAVGESPADAEQILGLLYATMALDRGDNARKECVDTLLSVPKDQATVPGICRVARELLAPQHTINATWVQEVLSGQAGSDVILLTAVACRNAGLDAWQCYREVARDVVSRSGAEAEVVVLVSQLGMLSPDTK